MSLLLAIILNLAGISLICLTQKKNSNKIKGMYSNATLLILRYSGFGLLLFGLIFLVLLEPSDLGLILWFGLQPLFIVGVAMLCADNMHWLVRLIKIYPFAIAVLLLATLRLL